MIFLDDGIFWGDDDNVSRDGGYLSGDVCRFVFENTNAFLKLEHDEHI